MSQYEESIIQELAPSWAQEILFRLSDSAIEFVNAIRILFSELSSHVTQLRLDNAFRNDSGAVRSRSFGHRGRGGNSRTGFSQHTRILLDYFYGLEKIWRYSPSFKSETSESASASKALQNGEYVDCMQACLSERLDDKHRSCKRIPSRTFFSIFKEISQFSMGKQNFSLSRSSIWAFFDPTSFHEGIATSTQMSKTAWDKDNYLLGRFVDIRIEQGGIAEECTKVKKLASSIGKAQAMSIALLPGRLMTRRLIELNNEALRKKIRIGTHRNSHILLPEVPKVEVFTYASDSDWGIVQGLCGDTRQETGFCSAQGLRAFVDPPSEFFDSPTLKFRPFCTQSSRLSFKDTYTDGMVNIRKDIQQDRYEFWNARCGYVRSPGEPQTVEICQLETVTKSSSNGRFQSPVEYLDESILLPTLEPGHEDNPIGLPREINLDTNNSLVENRDLVPRSNQNSDSINNQNNSRRSAPGTYKRKFDNVEEQGFVA
ncbi:hypothetical protein AYI70_g8765 [Smittium culicis]|uniref:Uncharacterized protein n=1 Tax=Smittium culicis TaxID=133412 RepID=A0A1R1XEG1_9FUNG|nr:hypothetical protein AYI70_g8765 [Smittium culicis]